MLDQANPKAVHQLVVSGTARLLFNTAPLNLLALLKMYSLLFRFSFVGIRATSFHVSLPKDSSILLGLVKEDSNLEYSLATLALQKIMLWAMKKS